MKIKTDHNGWLEFAVPKDCLPHLRLLQFHCRMLRIEGKTEDGRSWLIPLGCLDLSANASLLLVNVDRAQLASLTRDKK